MSINNKAQSLKKAPLPENKNPNKSSNVVNVHFGVFFDGTGAGGEMAKKEMRLNSNVEILQTYYKEDDYTCKLYLKGIGVVDLTEKDKYRGLIIGTGSTGIETKVKKAIQDIPIKISRKEKIPTESNINLHFEVFGFSRGAAAARHFVSEITNKKVSITRSIDEQLKSKNQEIKSITINYVGLFDTVSSHGLDFSNDVKKLGLDAIKNAEKVFHICAADEFRKFFALTDIRSVGKDKGTEVFITGSHTDIGGGIDPNWKNKAAKYGEGWTDSTEAVQSGYSNIALNLMATKSNEIREKFEILDKYEVSDDLQKTEQTIQNNLSSLKSAKDCFNLQEFDYKNLRANWLHFTAVEGNIIDSPHIVKEKDGVENIKKFERELIPG